MNYEKLLVNNKLNELLGILAKIEFVSIKVEKRVMEIEEAILKAKKDLKVSHE